MASFTDVDFYDTASLLSEEERAVRDTVRDCVSDRLMPVIGPHYVEHRFPIELVR
jgi:glutaryl-CoA dehydrogenase